jgi:hypothetical protein
MATPTVPVPTAVETWISRAKYLRWIDALAAWLMFVGAAVAMLPEMPVEASALVALAATVLGMLVQPLRLRWRPVSGWVGLVASRSLRGGHRAWFVRDGRADPVLITARRGLRLSIAAPNLGESETLSVRRTRVFLIPRADDPAPTRRP